MDTFLLPEGKIFVEDNFGPNIELGWIMEKSQEFLKREFINLVSDTLALLGAESKLVEDIKACKDNPFSVKIIDEIRKYNGEHEDKTKHTVALLNTTFQFNY